jgi:hypothetical protein
MKKLLALTTIALGIAFAGQAQAHGAKPKHGGTVQTVKDVAYELVNKDGKAVIYIEDHGKEVATAGASGKLTVLAGKGKSEVDLEASGANTLTSKSDVQLTPGTKAIASITMAGKEAVNVRFSRK